VTIGINNVYRAVRAYQSDRVKLASV